MLYGTKKYIYTPTTDLHGCARTMHACRTILHAPIKILHAPVTLLHASQGSHGRPARTHAPCHALFPVPIRYVESSLHRPQQRLDAILGLRPPFKDLPFSELDALYLHLLNSTDDPSRAADILAFLALYGEISPADIDKMLSLESGEAEVCLSRLSAIVNIGRMVDDICTASLLHKSFGDFLFDSHRSKGFSKRRMETKAWHSIRIIEIFSGKRFIRQLCQPFFSFYLITENHMSHPFIYFRFSLDLINISYNSWSIPSQSTFLDAVTHFPIKSYCKQLFRRSHKDIPHLIFLHNFYGLLFELVGFFFV